MTTEPSSSNSSCTTNQLHSHDPSAPGTHLLIPEGLKGRYQPPARTRLSASPHFPPKHKSEEKTPPTKNTSKTSADSAPTALSTPNLLQEIGPTQKRPLRIELPPGTMPRGLENRWTPPNKKVKSTIKQRSIKATGSLPTDASIQRKTKKNESKHSS
jgi:hypothetical protein